MNRDSTNPKAICPMPRAKDPKKMMRITISIDPEEYQAIEKMAEEDERSAAWVIRKAVREYLERENSKSVV